MESMKSVSLVVISVGLIVILGVWIGWDKEDVPGRVSPQGRFVGTSTEVQTESSTWLRHESTEWGFGFNYPYEWKILEDSFGGYYTQYNIVFRPVKGTHTGDPLIINVVLPEFTERTFAGLDIETESIFLDGVEGKRHTYEFRNSTHTMVVFPLNEYRLLIGTNGFYDELFKTVLNSFEFIE